jgi:hypothetical protein
MTEMATCLVGEDISVDFTFTALGTTTLTDPTLIQVVHRKPNLTETVYVYPTDPEVTRLSAGQYNFTKRMVNEPLTHVIRPLGSGEVNKAQEVFVVVTESYFLDPLPS